MKVNKLRKGKSKSEDERLKNGGWEFFGAEKGSDGLTSSVNSRLPANVGAISVVLRCSFGLPKQLLQEAILKSLVAHLTHFPSNQKKNRGIRHVGFFCRVLWLRLDHNATKNM